MHNLQFLCFILTAGMFQYPIKVSPLISWYVTVGSLVLSVTPEQTNAGSFLAGFRSTSATAV